MAGERFIPSLRERQLGDARSDFVIVEWTDSADDYAAIFRAHNSELLT